MVAGANHGHNNSGTQSRPLGNGVTRGIIANAGGGSPGTSVGGQHGNQDAGGDTSPEHDSTGVEWGEVRYETITRNLPGGERQLCQTIKEQQLHDQQRAGRWQNNHVPTSITARNLRQYAVGAKECRCHLIPTIEQIRATVTLESSKTVSKMGNTAHLQATAALICSARTNNRGCTDKKLL